MKETPLSSNEKAFVESAIKEGLRIDKRQLDEFRDLSIYFVSKDYGSVIVSLGDTKVFACVSCEVNQPKTSRPNEGTVFVNVEIGPMAAPHFEVGNLSESCIFVNRILERTIRDSRCIDMESLCIIAEEKVWNLRVDVTVLNHEGNVVDCACIAAITALAHFRRPDVTTSGDGEFIIHTSAEKDLIPLVLHHYPICVSYALFEEGKVPVADPTALEERISNASIVLAINSYKELCSLHLTGVTLTSPKLIQKCSELAAERARRIVEYIKHVLEENNKQRETGDFKGLSEAIKLSNITSNFHDAEVIERMSQSDDEHEIESTNEEPIEKPINKLDENTVADNKWNSNDEESSGSDEEMPSQGVKKDVKKIKEVQKKEKMIVIENSSDEEEETIVLH